MKGLSTILSTVILVAIVITVYALLTTFSTTLFKDQGSQIADRTSEAVDCSFSHIEIKDVYIDRFGKAVRVQVQNTGNIDERLTNAVLVNNDSESMESLNVPLIIERSNIRSIEFNTTGFIEDCDEFQRITITTSCRDVEYSESAIC